MIALLTWQPADTPSPETLTVDIPEPWFTEFRPLIGTDAWASSEAVAWINTRVGDQPWTPHLYRLARITALEPQP